MTTTPTALEWTLKTSRGGGDLGKTELGRTYWRVGGLAAPLLGRGLGTAFPLHLRNVPHTMETIMPAF